MVERALEKSEIRYINQADVALHKFMRGDSDRRSRAQDIINNLPNILSSRKDLLSFLAMRHTSNPDRITSLVLPTYPLIVTQSPLEMTAVSPILGCTLKALYDLANRIPQDSDFMIVQSTKSAKDISCEVKKRIGLGITRFVYNPVDLEFGDYQIVNPEDYVALAGEGKLNNETFRSVIENANIGGITKSGIIFI